MRGLAGRRVLVTGAAGGIGAAVAERVLDGGLRGPGLGCRAALPELLEQGAGWIVTFGSTAAIVGAPRLAAYSAAKGAVLNFTRSIAVEYAREGLHANCLCPGATETPPLKQLMAERPDADQFRDAQPIGRFATPDEIAGAASHRVSAEASFFVGSAV